MNHLVDKQKENKADKNKTDKDYDASQDYDASEIDRIKSVKNENENGSHQSDKLTSSKSSNIANKGINGDRNLIIIF